MLGTTSKFEENRVEGVHTAVVLKGLDGYCQCVHMSFNMNGEKLDHKYKKRRESCNPCTAVHVILRLVPVIYSPFVIIYSDSTCHKVLIKCLLFCR